ncbi:hypothetical protein C7389_11682 [Azoarcus indigens]|uniref:Uncharacterized protein n=1 Tax=Azoarcus indigens TaxID=29545 RepID=A0A4R6DSX2_9RHOO|nr:hypothetical protein C7389_11682 [Azoarcus indigens]
MRAAGLLVPIRADGGPAGPVSRAQNALPLPDYKEQKRAASMRDRLFS